nr:UPF0481 protein At3g47200-like [Quercus suber]
MEESAGWGIQREAEDQNQSTESHKEANTSSGNENHNKRLADNIRAQLERVAYSSILSSYRIIHINRVPYHIRSVNPGAYTPMVVSIGPIHHFNEKLQTMEKFVSIIREMEEMIRCCYAETSSHSMSSDDFVKMILLDAIFILELFHKYSTGDWDGDDPLQPDRWMFSFVRLDLVVLENQLPFFVLEELFNLAFVDDSSSLPLIPLTFNFFKCFNVQNMDPENVKIEHFMTDLIRAFQLPLNPLLKRPTRMMVKLWYSATELHDAGVKFEGSSSICLLDLHYEKGVLKMPRLVLDDQTEALVRNVMALEQFCHWNEVCLTDYFIFLDSLINTIEDINLLCDRGILVNNLVDNKAALSMVKNLVTNITCSGMSSDFTIICKELNAFYKKRFHRWMARLSVTTLKNQYFNNPWRGAGTIAACLLLLLTLIQTIMSILQVAKA